MVRFRLTPYITLPKDKFNPIGLVMWAIERTGFYVSVTDLVIVGTHINELQFAQDWSCDISAAGRFK